MNVARLLLLLIRLGAAVQLVLGIAFWTGHWTDAVPAHMMIGVVFVVLLWVLALVALIRRVNPGLAALAILWGVVIAGLGFAQRGMLVGDAHWVVRVAHLVISLAAVPMAEGLAKPRAAARAS